MASHTTGLLRLYLENLPQALPLPKPDTVEAKVNRLLGFSLDEEWVEDIGEEGAVNRELEAALFGFGPRGDDGTFKITVRGAGIEALADVLEYWLKRYPESECLKRWLKNASDSAEKCILLHNEPVSM